MGETVNMHVRDVPKEVKDDLAWLAEHDHISLNAYVVRVLEMASRRARNMRLLRDAPTHDITTEAIVDAVRAVREERDQELGERW